MYLLQKPQINFKRKKGKERPYKEVFCGKNIGINRNLTKGINELMQK